MNKNFQIINLIEGSEISTRIEIDEMSTQIGAYFIKNIIKEFINNNGDFKSLSFFDWTSKSVCDMCVCDKVKGE